MKLSLVLWIKMTSCSDYSNLVRIQEYSQGRKKKTLLAHRHTDELRQMHTNGYFLTEDLSLSVKTPQAMNYNFGFCHLQQHFPMTHNRSSKFSRSAYNTHGNIQNEYYFKQSTIQPFGLPGGIVVKPANDGMLTDHGGPPWRGPAFTSILAWRNSGQRSLAS